MTLCQRSLGILGMALMLLLAACGGADTSEPGPLRVGRDVYGSICSACHGEIGQGGTGPALATVLETFPSCSDHIKWVTLGSDQWKAQVGDTYGATNKPVTGGMPENRATLSNEEIQAAVVYERVRFGDEELENAVANCGLEAPRSD